MSALHQITAVQVGLERKRRSNNSFVERFDKFWKIATYRFLLPPGVREPRQLRSLLPEEFAQRCPDYLVMVDFQPKNVIVDPTGGVHLIDPDFGTGNPAMSVGFFLNGINQMIYNPGVRLRLSRVKSYQQAFLEAYLARVELERGQDLLFFYPWTLCQQGRYDIQRWPRAVLALKLIYSFFLRAYLRRLSSAERSAIQNPTPELFIGPLRS